MRPAYKTILCATDLSPVGNSALSVAHALAAYGSTLHVLTVVDAPDAGSSQHGESPPAGAPSAIGIPGALQRAWAHLRALCTAKPAHRGVQTQIHVREGWDAAREIEDLAQAVGADVVVLGTHGRTGFGRLLMGSVATEVLRRRKVPVLLLHDVHGREAQARASGA